MGPLAILTGDCINRFFFMYGHFAGQKKCDRNIEVPVLPRWP